MRHPRLRRGERRLAGVEPYVLPALLLAVAVFFSVFSETSATFPSSDNVRTIIGNQSVLVVAALGAMVPLICGQLDLSVGAVLGLASIVTASLLSDSGWPTAAAATAGVASGAGVGLLNGLLVTKAKVNGLLVTLAMSTIVTGAVTGKTGGVSIVEDIPRGLIGFGSDTTAGIPRILVVVVAVALILYFVLEHTPFGRYLYAVGSNAEAARVVGLDVERLVLASFVLSGTLAGVAGVLEVARIGGASPQIGPTFILPALAVVFLGATAIRPGRFNVVGTVVAIAFLASLTSGLNLAGAEAWVNDVVVGVALLAGVVLSTAVFGRRS
jgi:ribose transport system permease protein